jgi:CRP-like cAMP-binding protein
MSGQIDAAAMQQFRCFHGLTEAECAAGAACMERVTVSTGGLVFEQGEPGDAIYLVETGKMEIRVAVPGQPDRLLSSLPPGSIFGEMSMFTGAPRAATAVATGPTVVWRLTHPRFLEALDREEPWVCKFLHATAQVLAARLAVLDQELVNLISREEDPGKPQAPAAKVAELDRLRERLFTEWSF